MKNLRISVQKDDDYIYFLINRTLILNEVEEGESEYLEEGDEVEVEIPTITEFILDELDYVVEPEEVGVGPRYIVIRKSELSPQKEMVPVVKNVIKRCFNIEALISKI